MPVKTAIQATPYSSTEFLDSGRELSPACPEWQCVFVADFGFRTTRDLSPQLVASLFTTRTLSMYVSSKAAANV